MIARILCRLGLHRFSGPRTVEYETQLVAGKPAATGVLVETCPVCGHQRRLVYDTSRFVLHRLTRDGVGPFAPHGSPHASIGFPQNPVDNARRPDQE